MKLHRIAALLSRHLYLYKRSFPRVLEIVYWPFVDLLIWGFITLYLAQFKAALPNFVLFFLGALILWDVLFRAQQGITISFLEEIWSRNLMNLLDRKSTRLNSSHGYISYAVFCLKKKKRNMTTEV